MNVAIGEGTAHPFRGGTAHSRRTFIKGISITRTHRQNN